MASASSPFQQVMHKDAQGPWYCSHPPVAMASALRPCPLAFLHIVGFASSGEILLAPCRYWFLMISIYIYNSKFIYIVHGLPLCAVPKSISTWKTKPAALQRWSWQVRRATSRLPCTLMPMTESLAVHSSARHLLGLILLGRINNHKVMARYGKSISVWYMTRLTPPSQRYTKWEWLEGSG